MSENSLLWRTLAGALILLMTLEGLPLCSFAQERELLQASASGEYSAALSELPEPLRKEWIQQGLLLDSFEQQAIDIETEDRSSRRRLREDAAEERLQAQEEYREELSALSEEHNEEQRRLDADLSRGKYQRRAEALQEKYRHDTEDLRVDRERLTNEIDEDLEEDLDELATELEQALFDLRTEKEYAREQIKADTIEALLRHYQRQLEMEALGRIVASRGLDPLEGEAIFELLEYLRDRVDIEAARTDLTHSSVRITVTIRADAGEVDRAMKLFSPPKGQ